MNGLTTLIQLAVCVLAGVYFFQRIFRQPEGENRAEDTKKAEELNRLRRIRLSKPLTEASRPKTFSEIVGQEEGIHLLKAALCGGHPQHVIIYGPPGVGKTASARLTLEYAKQSEGTPFKADAPFIEADAATMRFDERSIADPLIGSVHDPIYQGAGRFGAIGIPEPKPGAVTRAHGGILFLDEIGELPPVQLNRLLKVLEDGCVRLESAYYNPDSKKTPAYIHDIFRNGLPADFRLVGATTSPPESIPEAIRSRCTEIFFSGLNLFQIREIIYGAVKRTSAVFEKGVCEYISLYAQNGRDAVKLVEMLISIAELDRFDRITINTAKRLIAAGHFRRRTDAYSDESIIDISVAR